MSTSHQTRTKKILMMALQNDSQISQNCLQGRMKLFKESSINESNSIRPITYNSNNQNTLFAAEEVLPEIQSFEELLPEFDHSNNNINLTKVGANEELLALHELVGDSFEILEEGYVDNFTELVSVAELNKQTTTKNLSLTQTPTVERKIIIEYCESTGNSNNDNEILFINDAATNQEVLNINTQVSEELLNIPNSINDSFEIVQTIPSSSHQAQREKRVLEENENCVPTNENGNPTPMNQHSTSETMLSSNLMKRKRSKENQRVLNKNKRMEGQKYLGFRKPKGQKNTFNDTERSERKLLPRCNCSKKDTKVTN